MAATPSNVKESRAAIELREENEAITKAQISGWISENMALSKHKAGEVYKKAAPVFLLFLGSSVIKF